MSKNHYFKYSLVLFGLLVCSSMFAQEQRTCGTMEYLEYKLEKHSKFKDSQPQTDSLSQSNRTSNKGFSNVITIPTVVHILHNNATQNISHAQILSQIAVLNADFRRLNADAVNTPSEFLPIAADTEIEFCLATTDPSGFATTGVTRTSTTQSSFGINDQIKNSTTGGVDAWNTANYLNIWVGAVGNGILGYAQFPGGNVNTDGIVIDYRYFGTTGTATPPFHLGRTCTHEVGHWLGLRHIWGDGGCSVDDSVTDTPLAGSPNFTGQPCTHPANNSCNEGTNDLPDMFQNFMDYSDDACMNLFTQGQKSRMRTLFEPGGARASLLNSNGCATDGVLPTCSDGFLNGTETGIDCGGDDCPSCTIFCNDGILNGMETEIDCGGICNDCPPSQGQACSVAIPIFNNQTYTAIGPSQGMGASHSNADHANWYLFVAQADGFMDIQSCGEDVDTRLWIYEGCCEQLTLKASADDECELSPGRSAYATQILQLSLTKGTQYYIEWDDRWSNSGFDFTFTFTTTTSCNDGVKNGDEIGIDCGGSSCQACDDEKIYCQDGCTNCPTCFDGIHNGNETDIDCGGICIPCPTCFDGIHNGNEIDIDCGGICNPCPTCFDGIHNGNETDIDCGGICIPCPTCFDGIHNGSETDIDCGGICKSCPTPIEISSVNMLSFDDPCSCIDPLNCMEGEQLYFHDIMRIPSTGTTIEGLDIRVAAAQNFYVSVPCSGNLLAPILGINGTKFKEVSNGVYELEFWRPSGILPTLSVIESGIVTIVPANNFEPICNQEECVELPAIPTFNQWGLPIFCLLLINLSIYILNIITSISLQQPNKKNN